MPVMRARGADIGAAGYTDRVPSRLRRPAHFRAGCQARRYDCRARVSTSSSSTLTRARAQRAPSVEPLFRAKAPLRVSFAGGGTDVAPFPEREGGLVLSATINRYAHATLQPRTDGRIRVESLDLRAALDYGSDDPIDYDGELGLVKAAVQRVAQLEEPRGIDLFL